MSPVPNPTSLGDTLRRLRKQAGLSQEELTRRLDGKVSYGVIAQVESHRRSTTREKVALLAAELGDGDGELMRAWEADRGPAADGRTVTQRLDELDARFSEVAAAVQQIAGSLDRLAEQVDRLAP